jgi:hypothetical protein
MLPPGWPNRLLTADATVAARVGHLCDLCVSSLDISGASVQLIASGPHRVTVHATDRVADQLDDLQLELGEGPAVDAVRTTGPMLEDELEHAGALRWPWFSPAAVRLGVGAAYAWPVQVGATPLGILGLHRRRPGALEAAEVADAAVVADAVAIVLLDTPDIGSADVLVWIITDQSRFRAEVHQATGMLTVQLDLGILDAFARLCAAAYADARSIGDLAHDIITHRIRLDAG